MVDSKLVGMRLPPDIVGKIGSYQDVFGWTPAQVVTQLLNYRDRINAIATRIEVVHTNQGGTLMFFKDGPDSDVPLDVAHVGYYLVHELQMSIAEGFREPFLGIDEYWKD